MLRGKFAVILLLLTVPLLATSRMVGGQVYTTQTVTTPVTNTQTLPMTVGTSVMTSTVPLSQVIFRSFTLPPSHGVCGIYFEQPFNATTEEIVSGTLNASSKVDLYIMTDAAYQSWKANQIGVGGNCTPRKLLLSQNATSYNFTTPVPSNGQYYVVVNNLSHSTVNAQLTISLTTNALTMFTTVMYSTLTLPNVQTLTLINLSTAQSQGSSSDSLTLTFLAIIICAAVGAIAYKVKRRK